MSHWAFVAAAYAVTVAATAALLAWALVSMRRAEADAEQLRSRE
jgi:hypothetical protein